MDSLQLVKPKKEQTAIEKYCSEQNAPVRVLMLDMACNVYGRTLDPSETIVWRELLIQEPADAVQWAFLEHLKKGQFFPKPAEIVSLIHTFQDRQRKAEQERSKFSERERLEQARQNGQLVGLEEVARIMTEAVERVKKMPSANLHLKPQKPYPVPPALQLTREQIAARQDKDREEIHKAEDGN